MVFMRLRIHLNSLCNSITACYQYSSPSIVRHRRGLASISSSFVELSSKPSSKYQVYISQSHDPFVNLSIEHYLLQKTPANSVILFLYINNPCVVIGRNQNPWLEANLRLLATQSALSSISDSGAGQKQESSGQVQLVRRRSGGGTVFHDHGNINYSVICPTPDFTRDKHVEMIVRAIRHENDRARVNERHDIVLDQGNRLSEDSWPDPRDMHKTAYSSGRGEPPPLKVSGSAYKLTRTRSLHHGTCLLNSRNIDFISMCLRSPARPFIKARGVESVRSPISNVYPADTTNASRLFKRHVFRAFADMYRLGEDFMSTFTPHSTCNQLAHGKGWVSGYLTDALSEVPEVQLGIKELQSPKWIYGQTPQFALSSHPTEDDNRIRPCLPSELPESARVYIRVRSGVIDSTRISFSTDPTVSCREIEGFDKALTGLNLYEIQDFHGLFQGVEETDRQSRLVSLATWLRDMFGKV